MVDDYHTFFVWITITTMMNDSNDVIVVESLWHIYPWWWIN